MSHTHVQILKIVGGSTASISQLNAAVIFLVANSVPFGCRKASASSQSSDFLRILQAAHAEVTTSDYQIHRHRIFVPKTITDQLVDVTIAVVVDVIATWRHQYIPLHCYRHSPEIVDISIKACIQRETAVNLPQPSSSTSRNNPTRSSSISSSQYCRSHRLSAQIASAEESLQSFPPVHIRSPSRCGFAL